MTVPWEENREEAQERKKNCYETLRADCVEKGWICHGIPIEVDCRGFLGHSVISFLSKIGITGRSLKVASNRLQTAAQHRKSRSRILEGGEKKNIYIYISDEQDRLDTAGEVRMNS